MSPSAFNGDDKNWGLLVLGRDEDVLSDEDRVFIYEPRTAAWHVLDQTRGWSSSIIFATCGDVFRSMWADMEPETIAASVWTYEHHDRELQHPCAECALPSNELPRLPDYGYEPRLIKVASLPGNASQVAHVLDLDEGNGNVMLGRDVALSCELGPRAFVGIVEESEIHLQRTLLSLEMRLLEAGHLPGPP